MPLTIASGDKGAHRRLMRRLRIERLAAGLSQLQLARKLPVRARAISEWECGVVSPELDHLIEWADALDLQLVVVERGGAPWPEETRYRPGEPWTTFQRRRLAAPLKMRREGLGLSQPALGARIGVSRATIQRWELAQVPPRTIAQVVWTRALGLGIGLQRAEQ